MTPQLSVSDLETVTDLLQHYAPAQPAIVMLHQHQGNLATSLDDLLLAADSPVVEPNLSMSQARDRQTLRQVFLRNLRREICGDDSFRTQVEEYNKNPTKAVLLTGLIVYLIDLVTLPINPAIATVIVLWVLKLGIRTFCDYTDPQTNAVPTASPG